MNEIGRTIKSQRKKNRRDQNRKKKRVGEYMNKEKTCVTLDILTFVIKRKIYGSLVTHDYGNKQHIQKLKERCMNNDVDLQTCFQAWSPSTCLVTWDKIPPNKVWSATLQCNSLISP